MRGVYFFTLDRVFLNSFFLLCSVRTVHSLARALGPAHPLSAEAELLRYFTVGYHEIKS